MTRNAIILLCDLDVKSGAEEFGGIYPAQILLAQFCNVIVLKISIQKARNIKHVMKH